VPIGETLAGARQRAGLTVAQVSEQTCIREAVIEGIEGGGYSACGGDFYARANIRTIAKVVGADSGPLIREYDALYRARGALSAVSLEELLATSVPAAQRRQPDLDAAGALLAPGYASSWRQAGSHVAGEPAVPAARPPGRWLNWAVVLGLVVVLGFGVYSHFSGPRPAADVPPAAGTPAAAHHPARHGRPGPAPKLTHAAVAPAPAPKTTHAAMPAAPAAATPAQTLTPASAAAPGPAAGRPPPAHRAAGGNRAAGPAHPQVHHRPPPEPARRQGPAPGPARAGHGHGRPHHHRQRAPAVQRTAGGHDRYLPGQSP
jgi:Helix-turn-helix domain